MEATRWGQKNAVWAKLFSLRFFCSHTAKSREKDSNSVTIATVYTAVFTSAVLNSRRTKIN